MHRREKALHYFAPICIFAYLDLCIFVFVFMNFCPRFFVMQSLGVQQTIDALHCSCCETSSLQFYQRQNKTLSK